MKINKIGLVALFIVTLVFSILFFLFKDIALEMRSLGLLGLFLINALSSAALFNPAPTFLTVIAGGSVYSPLLVAFVAAVGSALGDLVSYAIGVSGRGLLHKNLKKKPWFRLVDHHFNRFGGIILVVSALLPNALFDPIGMLAGISNYSPLSYVLLVFIGRFIRFYLFARFGALF